MRISIAELSANASGAVRAANESGEPATIANRKRRGEPTEAVLVPTDLWDTILRVPSVRKRIREHAAKQADQTDEAVDAA